MFNEYLKTRFKDDFSDIWDSFFTPKKVGFFITDLSAKNEILAEFSGACELFSDFYILPSEQKSALSHSNFFQNGQLYIQNPSSFLVPLNLNLSQNDEICDMCASPGGKSIALNFLAIKQNLSISQAVIESDKTRFFTLKKNLAKYGLQSIRAYNKDGRSIAKSCEGRFDKIILDAPCSSYSHFGADFKEKSRAELKAIARLQKGLLNAALCALKDGGEMIYSTCTFFEAENEEVIKNALNSRFEIEILPLNLPANAKIIKNSFGALILPDDVFDAFFISKIRKIKVKD